MRTIREELAHATLVKLANANTLNDITIHECCKVAREALGAIANVERAERVGLAFLARFGEDLEDDPDAAINSADCVEVCCNAYNED